MVAKFDHRSALLVSELTGFVVKKRWKPLVEKIQTTGLPCPTTEHMARSVRTDLARSSGLWSKKNSGRWRGVFSWLYLL